MYQHKYVVSAFYQLPFLDCDRLVANRNIKLEALEIIPPILTFLSMRKSYYLQMPSLELQMVRAVGVTRANEPEASVTIDIESDLNAQQLTLDNIEELQIDRAYLVSHWVKQRTPNMTIVCKAWNWTLDYDTENNSAMLS